MSQQISPATPKQSYVAAVAQPAAVTNMPRSGICTRAMTDKMTLNAAAASLHAAKVPTKPRTYTTSSVMAAARALIARTQEGNTPAVKTPSPNMKVDMHVAKIPSPNMKVATPKTVEVPRPDCTTSVLTVGAMTLEEQMQEMRKMLEMVLNGNEEQNKKIEDLQKEVISLGKQKVEEVVQTTIPEEDGDNKVVATEIIKADGVACNENQLEVLIADAVKNQLTGSSSGGTRYNKPYSKRIDNLHMPQGYQPPKFQQFDGKGNPKQHLAHFVETCSNAGTEGDLLVKQFVRSLKGIAFDWYTDLDAESINSWGQLEDAFFNRFYSTRRVVSMSELTNAKQGEEEPVVEYINRWRALCFECKDRISETSAVEMCIDGMNWELLYILKGNKPKSFQELATSAHDMEITVRGHKHISSSKAFRKMEHEDIDKATRSISEEAMVISTNNGSQKEVAVKRTGPTLKELQAKQYPFSDSDLSGMLDDLLKKGVIKLPEAKRPDEVNKTNNPKYCRYHRLVSHNLENCIALKELIMRLVHEGKIVLDTDETAEANHTSAAICGVLHTKTWEIRFGTMDPVKVTMSKPQQEAKKSTVGDAIKGSVIPNLQKNAHLPHEDEERWTLVTRRKAKKHVFPQSPPTYRKKKQTTKKRLRQIKGKKRPKKGVRSQVLPVDLLEQIPPAPITLRDFFPESYLNKVADNVASGAINDSNKEELDEKIPNTKCTTGHQSNGAKVG